MVHYRASRWQVMMTIVVDRGVVAVAQGREHALLHSEARLEVA
jgi:hypothetical protein